MHIEIATALALMLEAFGLGITLGLALAGR